MADNYRTLSKQIDKLATRIDHLEGEFGQQHRIGAGHDGDGQHFCALPQVRERELGPNVSPDRERLIRYLDKK
jgi:hypothetical protein